jgi:DHA1 family multidrug resistance protein-like MFS transporter
MRAGDRSAKTRRVALWGVIGAVFLVGNGVGSILPILPLYLRERHASYAMLGMIVGARMVAGVLGQYPAGRLSDRFGRRPVMIAGLLLTAVTTAAFVLPMPTWGLVALRFAQGIGGAAFGPGARSAVADLVPDAERGIAYGWMSGAERSGFILGPLAGGALAALGRGAVFQATAVALLLAAVVIALTLRSYPSHGSPSDDPVATAQGPSRLSRRGRLAMGAVISLGGVGAFMGGVYTVMWSLFMQSLGASDWVVGLSFSLWALPLVITTPFAGWAADRWDRRWLAVASMAIAAAIAPLYPLVGSIVPVLIVGAVEGIALAFGDPAMNAFLMNAVPAEQRGRAQGTVGTAESAVQTVGAALGGVLFGVGAAVPFLVVGGVGLALVGASLPMLLAAGRSPNRAPGLVG